MKRRTPTLLCVDDDPDVLEVLKDYLTAQGFNVVTAANGLEALFQIARHTPKAVILDLFMPRLGGLGALDRIKRLDSSIVVIVISGVENAARTVRETGLSVAGALEKPLDPAQLLETLVQAGVAPRRSVPGARTSPRFAGARPLMRKQALVVDDDPEIREVLTDYLQGERFEVRQAASGEEAIHRMLTFRPQVVLLDIALPGFSGMETLRRIKALPRKTCVVMVSGLDDVETARRALALGASDYVTKPVDFTYLSLVLEIHTFMTQLELESP